MLGLKPCNGFDEELGVDSEIFEALTVGGNGEEFGEVDLLSMEGKIIDALLVGGNVEELDDAGFLGVEDEWARS